MRNICYCVQFTCTRGSDSRFTWSQYNDCVMKGHQNPLVKEISWNSMLCRLEGISPLKGTGGDSWYNQVWTESPQTHTCSLSLLCLPWKLNVCSPEVWTKSETNGWSAILGVVPFCKWASTNFNQPDPISSNWCLEDATQFKPPPLTMIPNCTSPPYCCAQIKTEPWGVLQWCS